MSARYDTIGQTYATTRRTDPRIAAPIWAALGNARTVLNVGAGAGSYEPQDRYVLGLEPSAAMRAQRPPTAAPCVAGRVEELPFDDDSFDVVMGVLTLHHWDDWRAGVAECRRVARDRVVLLSWDPAGPKLWLSAEYFPHMASAERASFAPLAEQADALGGARVETVPVPHDCVDGFMGAHWRRPAAYLDPQVRAGISTFALRGDERVEAGLSRLEDDLSSGAWARDHADLLEREELDLGYRLLVSG